MNVFAQIQHMVNIIQQLTVIWIVKVMLPKSVEPVGKIAFMRSKVQALIIMI